MNVPIVGRIYHVVNKTTGEVIKVGSTIHTISKRQSNHDYRKNYKDCILIEAYAIQSSELDWYEPKNPYCPFVWHLFASEHMEILRCNTFRKGKGSNQQSPLDQKFFGLDGYVCGLAGGLNQKKEDKARGGHTQGLIQGKKNVESGLWARVVSLGGQASGRSKSPAKQAANAKNGERFGNWSIESGHLASLRTPEHQSKAGRAGGKKGGPAANHLRWHLNRGIVNPQCALCREATNGSIQQASIS